MKKITRTEGPIKEADFPLRSSLSSLGTSQWQKSVSKFSGTHFSLSLLEQDKYACGKEK